MRFADRFVLDAANDHDRFHALVNAMLGSVFGVDWASLHESLAKPDAAGLFCSFLTEGDEHPPYTWVTELGPLRTRLEDALELYDMEPKRHHAAARELDAWRRSSRSTGCS